MLCHLEEIGEARKPRVSRELGRDIRERDLEHLRDDDLAGSERVATTDLYVRSLPQSNGGRDLASAATMAEGLDELRRPNVMARMGGRRKR